MWRTFCFYWILICLPSFSFLRWPLNLNLHHITFYYHPSYLNPDSKVELTIGDTNLLRKHGFRSDFFTVIVIHGFVVDYRNMENVRNAFLRSQLPVNVISMDWSNYTSITDLVDLVITPFTYIATARHIDKIGLKLADFVCFLLEVNAAEMNRIHFVGHSLGAHVSGTAGRELTKRNGKLVWRISALDPAGPLFDFPINVAPKLRPSDAYFVDTYHATIGTYGGVAGGGHVNFILNGGHSSQPGCNLITDNVFFCSHGYARVFFAWSFERAFKGCPCSHLIEREVSEQYRKCIAMCSLPIPVGISTPTNARGQYAVEGPEYNPIEALLTSPRERIIFSQRAKMFGININDLTPTRPTFI